VCLRNATITASSAIVSTVEAAVFGQVGRSAIEVRFFHLATVLIPSSPRQTGRPQGRTPVFSPSHQIERPARGAEAADMARPNPVPPAALDRDSRSRSSEPIQAPPN
jgi:hypothetical protein